MRTRFDSYVDTLRSYAEEFGVKEVPFFINIHGCSGGRAMTFPIGISQLYQTYNREGFVSGSDIYLGEIKINNFQDLYLINTFMDSVNSSVQPLTSIEFNCGDGNFGNDYGGRNSPAATDFRTRMCIAQGNRLLNFYLFAGGYNYRMDKNLNDGNDRIGITGERHGFAAPINPEGEKNYTFQRMSRVLNTMGTVKEKLADMKEEHDNFWFGFISDYYMTEYQYPKSDKIRKIQSNLERFRAGQGWEIMARALLLNNFRFRAVHIQKEKINPQKKPVIVLPTAKYMSPEIQKILVSYVNQGGSLFLYGLIPVKDMEGEKCSILADFLNVFPQNIIEEKPGYYPSVEALNWAAPQPEIRTNYAQLFETGENVVPLFKLYDNKKTCGCEVKRGEGRAVIMAFGYNCNLSFFKTVMNRMGVTADLTHDCSNHGIFMTTSVNKEKERFLHLLNLDDFEKYVNIYYKEKNIFGKKIFLDKKEGLMLPLNLNINGMQILYSTAEIIGLHENSIDFRLTQSEDEIAVKTERNVRPDNEYRIYERKDKIIINSLKNARIDDKLSVKFK